MLDEKSECEVAVADANEKWREQPEDPSLERSRPLIRFRVEEITGGEDDEGLQPAAEQADWRHVRTFETRFDDGGVARHGLTVYKWPGEVADEDSRSVLSAPQSLADHAREAAARAREMATRLALPDDEVEALSVAARLHDDGKAASRWQNAMNAPKDNRPYAKTSVAGTGVSWRGTATSSGRLSAPSGPICRTALAI